jgi:muconolactone delta-isomerase
MRTTVPSGTSTNAVDEMRRRESARAAELAAAGTLLRLWRPPQGPGQWRTFGLFSAAGAGEVELALLSMPLRAWRIDHVTPLGAHPNDPAESVAMRDDVTEYFVDFVLADTSSLPQDVLQDGWRREALAAREAAAQGWLRRMWKLPEEGHYLGLWQSETASDLAAVLAQLPMAQWLKTSTTPLSRHPSDPREARLHDATRDA